VQRYLIDFKKIEKFINFETAYYLCFGIKINIMKFIIKNILNNLAKFRI